jgi:hypothetical protein
MTKEQLILKSKFYINEKRNIICTNNHPLTQVWVGKLKTLNSNLALQQYPIISLLKAIVYTQEELMWTTKEDENYQLYGIPNCKTNINEHPVFKESYQQVQKIKEQLLNNPDNPWWENKRRISSNIFVKWIREGQETITDYIPAFRIGNTYHPYPEINAQPATRAEYFAYKKKLKDQQFEEHINELLTKSI